MKRLLAVAILAAVGCRVVRVEKHDPVVFSDPETKQVVVQPGGWEITVHSFCMFTNIGDLDISIKTNGIISAHITDLTSSSDTNSVKAVAEATSKAVVEALPLLLLATNSTPSTVTEPL